ncbi:108aa long hypothetical protein [Pyrococcus horikoshii OT3]|uniref:Uncharacterized protein n=1 Tax=Pyrococcus horikoshii (strain ATCC 700860 / DSM 12428 / JCM 9974 / NBRC 100139 / OT-3) TaxID=70601 RepID=O58630_PYRHO|nr:108aa long hypothetical protein [Pyrococcus horikoshii OT3]
MVSNLIYEQEDIFLLEELYQNLYWRNSQVLVIVFHELVLSQGVCYVTPDGSNLSIKWCARLSNVCLTMYNDYPRIDVFGKIAQLFQLFPDISSLAFQYLFFSERSWIP